MLWKRVAWIAGGLVVVLFVMWRVSCNCAIQSPPQAIQTASQGQAAVAASGAQNPATAPAAKSPAQYPSTDQVLESDFGAFICWTASEYPGDLPVLVAFFAAVVGWFSANYFTARVKRIDATLEFNKRFHELIERQDALNRKYEEDKIRLEEEGNRNPRDPLKLKAAKNSLKCSEKEGVAWWWEFFDLLLHEFDFWHQNLVTRVRFLEWMVWRWADSHPKDGTPLWTTCGIGYIEGWELWRTHPAHGSRLIGLLEEIHAARHPRNVPQIVAKYRRRSWIDDDVKKENIRLEPGRYRDLAGKTTFVVT
jgi:hypothetical protein